MIDHNIHVWWAKGQEWVVKWENDQNLFWSEYTPGTLEIPAAPGFGDVELDISPS